MSLQTISSINSKMGKSHTSAAINRVIRSVCGDIAKWSMFSLIEELKQDYWGLRREVARALGEMGSDAQAAVGALIKALEDPNNYTRKVISHALGQIGKPALLSLIEALKDNDWRVRKRAADALGDIGPVARIAVPALIEVLRDDCWWVRDRAVAALGKIRSHANKAVPAIIKACEDDERLCVGAIEALRKIRPNPRVAIPLFIKGLKNEDRQVRRSAYYAFLADLCHSQLDIYYTKTVTCAMINGLRDKENYIREAATSVLRLIGQPSIPYIVKAIQKEEKLNISTIDIEILGKISKPVVPAMVKAFKLEDALFPPEGHAPTNFSPSIRKDLLSLFEAAYSESESKRNPAIDTLNKIGFDVTTVLPYLIEVLKSCDILVSTEAAYTLGNIGKPAIPILIETLKKNRGRFCRNLACALGYMGPNARAAVPILIEALMDEDPLSSMQITYTLAKIKHGVGAALHLLISKLKYEDNYPCRSALSKRLLETQIHILLSILGSREQRILRLRLGLEDGRKWTLEQVGKKVGVTKERVRQIEANILRTRQEGSMLRETSYSWRIVNHSTGESHEIVDPHYKSRDEAIRVAKEHTRRVFKSTDRISVTILNDKQVVVSEISNIKIDSKVWN